MFLAFEALPLDIGFASGSNTADEGLDVVWVLPEHSPVDLNADLPGEEISRLCADHACKANQGIDMDPLVATLDVGDRASREADGLRHLELRESGPFAGLEQVLAQLSVESVVHELRDEDPMVRTATSMP